MVLDPFCGCATACIAADQLGRWVGIDISPKAAELVNMRLQQTMGSLFHHSYVTIRTDIPQRTDIDAPIPYRQNKHVLYGQQEGLCNGCRRRLPLQAVRGRSRRSPLPRRHRPPPQPATPLLKLQPHQGRPSTGVPHGPLGRDSSVKRQGTMSLPPDGHGSNRVLTLLRCRRRLVLR